VLISFPTRPPLRSRVFVATGVGLLTFGSRLARASVLISTPDCSVTGSGWSCYLPGILQFLVVVAVLLGLILIAVVAVAVRSYFKIKHDEKVGS
jgi:uncharacterized membrane protein YkgB